MSHQLKSSESSNSIRRSPRFTCEDNDKNSNEKHVEPGFECYEGTGFISDLKMLSHECLWDEFHPECPLRLSLALNRCEELGLLNRVIKLSSEKVPFSCVEKIHSRYLIDLLKQCENKSVEELKMISSNFDSVYVHPTTFEAAMLAAGCSLKLVRSILDKKIQNGIALIRPPGHHATYDKFCGYCYLNNVAISAQDALDSGKAKKILIVDWDIHHGQATQQVFYSNPNVLYFSIHRYDYGHFWPHLRESDYDYVGADSGIGYNFNIPLNESHLQIGDYIAIFHRILLPVAYEFQPDLILLSAGYDAALGCPEGDMCLIPPFYAHMLSMLMPLANGHIAVILEGGYCLKSLKESVALTLRTLLGDPCPFLNNISTCRNSHQPYWKCFQLQRCCSFNESLKVPFFMPTIKYFGKPYNNDVNYSITNSYPILSKEIELQYNYQLDLIIENTKLSVYPERVCIYVDENLMIHSNMHSKNHPERPERISAILAFFEKYNILKRCKTLDPRMATHDELMLVHSENLIYQIENVKHMSSEQLKHLENQYQSVYLCPHTGTCAALAVGGLLQVVDHVLQGNSQSGVAVVRPPGHHAEPDEPCGFCVFNNVAVAAKYAIKNYNLERILIIDWDVHHGNGIQHIFANDNQVLYISLHRYDHGHFFPCSSDASHEYCGKGIGEGFTINIPWNKHGVGDTEYLNAFFNIVLPVSYQYNPELILVSAGFDAAKGDPLGGYKITPEAYAHFTHLLSTLAGGRIILSLEGGYNLSSTALALTFCTKTLLGDPCCNLKPLVKLDQSALDTIHNVINIQKKFWKCLSSLQYYLPEEEFVPVVYNHLPTESDFDDIESSFGMLTIDKPSKYFINEAEMSNIEKSSQMFHCVSPLSWCPHLEQVQTVSDCTIHYENSCLMCKSTLENWFCLICFQTYCSRYVGKHMLKHYELTQHAIALSYSDLSAWCYSCDSYVHNEALLTIKEAIYNCKFPKLIETEITE